MKSTHCWKGTVGHTAGRTMILWNQLKIFFGSEICEMCGSANVMQQGFEHNHRHECQDCEHITVVTQS